MPNPSTPARRSGLLPRGIDRTKPDTAPWWFPVGGGLAPGETPEEAATRETREETGLAISDPGPTVFTRRFTWDFEGEEYDQEEWFFLVRTSTFEPTVTEWTDTESATIEATAGGPSTNCELPPRQCSPRASPISSNVFSTTEWAMPGAPSTTARWAGDAHHPGVPCSAGATDRRIRARDGAVGVSQNARPE
jgi:hypothetical protein